MLPHNLAAEMQRYNVERHRRTGPQGPWIEHLMDDEGLSYEEAKLALNGWEFIPFTDPKYGHMATLIKRNREVHFAIYRRFRHKAQVTSRRIAEFLQPLLDQNIFLVTKVAKEDSARFIEHLGFQELGVDAQGLTCYILNAIKYPKVRHANPI